MVVIFLVGAFRNVISAHLLNGPFVLLCKSFAVQKFSNLMESQLSIFAFLSLACGDISKKIFL